MTDSPVDELWRLKKDPCAPTLTLISALAAKHGCCFADFAEEAMDPWRPSEASKSRNTLALAEPSTLIPRNICGMRWVDASSVEPLLALKVASVIKGIQVSSMNMGRATSGDDEIVKVKTHACCLTRRYYLHSIHFGAGR
jgi:hypothetical protein